jgi:hypothetical protein
MVAILDVFPRFMGAARSEVNAKHRLRLGQLAPLDKFVCSKRIGLGAEPSEIEPFRSFCDRTYTIFPAIARHEIAPGVTNDRRTQLSNQLENVPSKPVTVRCWVARFKNPRVNAPAHVLNERPKKTPVQLGNAKIGIDDDLGFIHRKSN